MNRGQHKTFITVALLIVSIVTAILIELIDGAAGGASTNSLGANSPPATGSSASGSKGAGSGSGSTSHAQTAPANTHAIVAAGVYHTLGTDIRLRAQPTTQSAVLAIMSNLGTRLTLTCYVAGESIGGDPYWYRATYAGQHGYVAGFWVATGPDPLFTRLRACA
jgi:hypothetical protein